MSSDDDITVDFSKIKNIFKKKKTEVEKPSTIKPKSDDDIFDYSQIMPFILKFGFILLLVIPIMFSVHYRMQSAYLPITDDWAENSVYNFYRSQFANQISIQYPNLPTANKQALAEQQFQEFLVTQKATVDQQIQQASQQYKSLLQDENGDTYLLAIDPYLWYRTTKNLVNYGVQGDTIIDGDVYDSLRNGQGLRKVIWEGHPIAGALLYKFFHIFNPNISIMRAVFLLPMLIVTLSVIPAFFIGRRIGGDVAGFFASMMVAIHPALLSRTAAGFSDTDPYNAFFPLLITWIFIESYYVKEKKYSIILSVLAGLLVATYMKFWGGWWYTFDFIIAAMGGFFVLYLIRLYWQSRTEKKQLRLVIPENWKITMVPFIITSVITLIVALMLSEKSFLVSVDTIFKAIIAPFSFLHFFDVAITTAWPNVLTTVAELNKVAISQVIGSIGGKFMFVAAVVGLFFSLYYSNKKLEWIWFTGSVLWALIVVSTQITGSIFIYVGLLSLPIILGLLRKLNQKEFRDHQFFSVLIISIWFFSTVIASTSGVRFVALLVPAFSLGFGLCLGYVFMVLTDFLSKEMNIQKTLVSITIFLLLFVLLINPIKAAAGTARNEIPSMNDAWYNSLRGIHDDTNDSIITSWWDFGHWFTAIAERRVTFDGGDQGRRIHWVGKSFLVDSEEHSVGILRMLNCDQNNAFDKLFEYTAENTIKSIDIINTIVVLSKEEAYDYLLSSGLTEDESNDVLLSTHCEPLPQYYIASEDMIGKSGVWAHFGSWNFTRGSMFQSVIGKPYDEGVEILTSRYSVSLEEADKLYYEIQTNNADQWVAGWPSYASGLGGCVGDLDALICSNTVSGGQTKFEIDLINLKAIIKTQNQDLVPYSLVYADEEGVKEKVFEDSTVPFSIAVIPANKEATSFQNIMVAPELADSIFTKLFFYQGHGLSYYKVFSDMRGITGGRILVYKVDWSGAEKHLAFNFSRESEAIPDELIIEPVAIEDNTSRNENT